MLVCKHLHGVSVVIVMTSTALLKTATCRVKACLLSDVEEAGLTVCMLLVSELCESRNIGIGLAAIVPACSKCRMYTMSGL